MAELRVKGTGTLKLFESDNTSSVTIASPASLGADRTVTLPDASVTLASGTMLATDGDGSSLTGLTPGITEADLWYVTSSFTDSGIDIVTANWSRFPASLGFNKMGTGMSESSGVFTFPSTGLWKITWHFYAYHDTDASYVGGGIYTTEDDFNDFIRAAQTYTNTLSGVLSHVGIYVSTIFDCEDTATHKVEFYTEAQADTDFIGNATAGRMTASFTRLGDTP